MNEQTSPWYMVNRDGMATLCVDRADAEKEAADAQSVWPHMGPHRAVQLRESAGAWFTAADMATAAAQGFRDGQAEELAAMRAGGEPVAYRHLWPADDECGTAADWEYFDSPTGEDCADCQPLYTHPQPAAQDAELLDWLGNQYVTVRIPLPYGSRECFIGAPDDNDGAAPSPWDIRAAIRTAIAAQQGDSHE